jgi:hypothetical protein
LRATPEKLLELPYFNDESIPDYLDKACLSEAPTE